MKQHKIAVLGNGAWGSALAGLAAQAGHSVWLWGRTTATASQSESLKHTTALSDLKKCAILIVALPVRVIPKVLEDLISRGIHPRYIINASKGLDPETGDLLSKRFDYSFNHSIFCALSGPNLATEIAAGLSAASSFYCPTDDWETFKGLFNKTQLRLYHCSDRIGIQLAGALKNIVAIACGMSDGLGLGHNMKATIMTRGLHEIMRLGNKLGAQPETFFGLSGMGDVILTCSSTHSRNFQFGLKLMQSAEATAAAVIEKIGTVEGVSTVASLQKLLAKIGALDLPLCQAVHQVIFENAPPQAIMRELLERPLKRESGGFFL